MGAGWGGAHLAFPQTFPRHHADPGQSEGLPGEKGSLENLILGNYEGVRASLRSLDDFRSDIRVGSVSMGGDAHPPGFSVVPCLRVAEVAQLLIHFGDGIRCVTRAELLPYSVTEVVVVPDGAIP